MPMSQKVLVQRRTGTGGTGGTESRQSMPNQILLAIHHPVPIS
jgi:hypothetical protein